MFRRLDDGEGEAMLLHAWTFTTLGIADLCMERAPPNTQWDGVLIVLGLENLEGVDGRQLFRGRVVCHLAGHDLVHEFGEGREGHLLIPGRRDGSREDDDHARDRFGDAGGAGDATRRTLKRGVKEVKSQSRQPPTLRQCREDAGDGCEPRVCQPGTMRWLHEIERWEGECRSIDEEKVELRRERESARITTRGELAFSVCYKIGSSRFAL